MADFAGSMATAQEASQKRNPFGLILDSWNKAQTRRYEEDAQRKKEEGALKNALTQLGANFEYDKTLQSEKAKEERTTGLYESLRKGEVQQTTETGAGTFEGTPFGAVGRYAATPKQTSVYLVDPTTGQMKEANTGKAVDNATVPKGSKIISQPGQSPAEKSAKISRENLGGTIVKMENLLKDIPSKEGLAGRFSGLVQRGSAMAGYNEKLQTYNSFKQAILGQIVKTIGGETGSRLSDQDVKRMAGVLPSEFSTTKERELKLKLFKQMVNDTAISYGAKPMFGEDGQQHVGEQQAKSKAQRANEIAQANPNLSKEQIVQQVNQEFNQ